MPNLSRKLKYIDVASALFCYEISSSAPIMPRLVFVYLVISVLSPLHVRSSHARDLDSVLNILGRQVRNGIDDRSNDRASLSFQFDKGSSPDSDVEVHDVPNTLRTEDIAELFKQVPLTNIKNTKKSRGSKDQKQRISKADNFNLIDESEKPHVKNAQKALEDLLAQSLNQILESKTVQATEKIHIPAIYSNSDNDKNNDVSSLDKYSKIYILLNPNALAKSKNKQFLNELLSQLLPTSSSKRHEHGRQKLMRYKGFLVNNDARRARRDSNEMYAPKDSMEEDYKPKRGRNSGGNGGGGSGGRTAIPYIRHRGDIYEKDN